MFISGFGFVFEWMQIGALGLLGCVITMIWRSFNDYDRDYYIPVEEVKKTELAAGRRV
jgi:cytochrome aa3-600 menaquinol oxidase subunit 1